MAVMEEMTEALQFSDDSNGDIGGSIDFSFELLADIAKKKLPEEIRLLLFEYCLSVFEKRTYSGWDWHLGMLHLASEILINEVEAQRVIEHLDKAQHSEYEKDEAQHIKFNIIKKARGEKEADKFIEANLFNPNLRREALAKALKNKAYEKGIKISEDGIRQDEKEKHGLAKEWLDWLLKISQAQNDKEKIAKYARLLFIDNFRNERDYYQVLRNNVRPEKWTVFVEEMVSDIALKKRGLNFGLIATIYIKEQWWKKLFELIKKNPSLDYLDHYEKYLSKDYAEEIVLLYGNEIVKYMESNIGRKHYKTVCRYLRRMIKLGGRESAEKIITEFKKQYPQRRALIEELGRV